MATNPSLPALERACKAVAGSTRLAQLLTERGRKVSKSSISRWKREQVPAEACPDIEAITGVKCEELRADVNWAVLRNTASQSKPADNGKRRRSSDMQGAQ
jgi:DNA-binding transcriptional regulator YdaS (Cro superfamily)